MRARMFACLPLGVHASLCVHFFVCMYVSMHVCLRIPMYIYIYIYASLYVCYCMHALALACVFCPNIDVYVALVVVVDVGAAPPFSILA